MFVKKLENHPFGLRLVQENKNGVPTRYVLMNNPMVLNTDKALALNDLNQMDKLTVNTMYLKPYLSDDELLRLGLSATGNPTAYDWLTSSYDETLNTQPVQSEYDKLCSDYPNLVSIIPSDATLSYFANSNWVRQWDVDVNDIHVPFTFAKKSEFVLFKKLPSRVIEHISQRNEYLHRTDKVVRPFSQVSLFVKALSYFPHSKDEKILLSLYDLMGTVVTVLKTVYQKHGLKQCLKYLVYLFEHNKTYRLPNLFKLCHAQLQSVIQDETDVFLAQFSLLQKLAKHTVEMYLASENEIFVDIENLQTEYVHHLGKINNLDGIMRHYAYNTGLIANYYHNQEIIRLKQTDFQFNNDIRYCLFPVINDVPQDIIVLDKVMYVPVIQANDFLMETYYMKNCFGTIHLNNNRLFNLFEKQAQWQTILDEMKTININGSLYYHVIDVSNINEKDLPTLCHQIRKQRDTMYTRPVNLKGSLQVNFSFEVDENQYQTLTDIMFLPKHQNVIINNHDAPCHFVFQEDDIRLQDGKKLQRHPLSHNFVSYLNQHAQQLQFIRK